MTPETAARPAKIEARSLAFSYHEEPVLRGLDFSADEGDVVAVLGPNGAGKSTLFRCLLGFLRPQAGEVLVSGRNVSAMSRSEAASHLAYIPQSAATAFNYTVLETVLMGLTSRLGRFRSPGSAEVKIALDALDSLGIAHLKDRGCGQISGGERQLALLARALAQNAGILIMDEPTANLDYCNSWRVMDRISGLAGRGYTMIFSTHDPNQALFHAGKVLVIEAGRVVAAGAAQETLSGDLLSKLYHISVSVRKIPYGGGEALISVPGG